MSTMEGSMKLLSDAGIMSDDALDEERLLALVNAVLELNMVPLVHAHEWNLTPEGPLKFP